MPIHDQGYHRYRGERDRSGAAWQVIARAGIRTVLAQRKFLALLLFAWGPFLVRAVQVYIASNFQQASFLQPKGETFREFLDQQGIFVFFVTIYVGAGLIAADRRANALQIYLSKPLLRMEYIGGKLAILMTFLLFVTLLPGLLLLVLQVLFSGSLDFLRQNLYVIPAVVLASLLRVFVASFAMLALSALSKSTRYVAILYTGAIFFTDAMFLVLRLITNSTRVAWVSFSANLENVTDVMFRQTPRYDTPVIVSVLVLAGLIAISLSVLERRVKGVEVVS